ncbi:protease modulator HflC [Cochlodiniinecator piscidefendens]|uniref:protease modulator HflC n=1 Tax=Cochlodiniinecator piscidefendens TaxID=2715756 RepID=UPI00140C2D41|nr:protease modulator HflC [Cochlodiniinecator piscidefendens]
MRKSTLLLPLLALIIAGIMSSVIIVDERQKVLILQFGRVVSVQEEPGLAFKIPVIQEVVRYDDRILSRDIPEREVTPSDDRRLIVDAFARYQISDPVRFRQAVGAGGERAAEDRLDGIFIDEIRRVLGTVSSDDILSSDRRALMNRISQAANIKANALGIRVIDVRLKQTNLPPENLEATYLRMITEREREARDEVARGGEAALSVRSQADREAEVIVSDAQRQALIIEGEADARRNSILASVYGRDPEFFDFYRSLEAYRSALQGENSTMVLSPNSDFFTYLNSDGRE